MAISGSGSQADPYLVSSRNEIVEAINAIRGKSSAGTYYAQLTADIDGGYTSVWEPVISATITDKVMVLDFDNHIIKNFILTAEMFKLTIKDTFKDGQIINIISAYNYSPIESVTLDNISVTILCKSLVKPLLKNIRTNEGAIRLDIDDYDTPSSGVYSPIITFTVESWSIEDTAVSQNTDFEITIERVNTQKCYLFENESISLGYPAIIKACRITGGIKEITPASMSTFPQFSTYGISIYTPSLIDFKMPSHASAGSAVMMGSSNSYEFPNIALTNSDKLQSQNEFATAQPHIATAELTDLSVLNGYMLDWSTKKNTGLPVHTAGDTSNYRHLRFKASIAVTFLNDAIVSVTGYDINNVARDHTSRYNDFSIFCHTPSQAVIMGGNVHIHFNNTVGLASKKISYASISGTAGVTYEWVRRAPLPAYLQSSSSYDSSKYLDESIQDYYFTKGYCADEYRGTDDKTRYWSGGNVYIAEMYLNLVQTGDFSFPDGDVTFDVEILFRLYDTDTTYDQWLQSPYISELDTDWVLESGASHPTQTKFPVMKEMGAFCNTSLASITIPSNVESIGRYAFKDSSLQAVTLPASCTYYATSFPSGCTITGGVLIA